MLAKAVAKIYKTFLSLTDTPSSYSGQAGKVVKVNPGETGLEFGADRYWTVSRDARDYGIVADGVTDNATAINTAIADYSTVGGGVLEFPAGTYLITSTITLKKLVYVRLHHGATLKWGGAAGGTMITSLSDRVLVYAGLGGGGTIAMQNASIGFSLHSHQYCLFNDIHIQSSDATKTYSIDSIVFKLVADSSAGTDAPSALKNIMCNEYRNIYQGGGLSMVNACGTFFYIEGATNVPVTLNTFHNLMAHVVWRKGINLVQWVDNNLWVGSVRINMYGNDSVGLDINTFNPTTEAQVYLNNFHDLAIDTFTHPTVPDFESFTGRIGVKIGFSRHNKIDNFYQQAAEGGSVVDSYSQSHYIVFHDYDMVGQPIRLLSKNLANFDSTTSADFANGDTTPSVRNGGLYRNLNSMPITITSFDDGYNGQFIEILHTTANTTYSETGNIRIPNASSLTPASGEVVRFRKFSTLWYQVGGGGSVDPASFGIDGGAYTDTYISTANVDAGAY